MMPSIETHIEIAKPLVGGSTSLFAGILLEYLAVTPPIFVAASFGAIMAVIMLKEFQPVIVQGIKVPPPIVALFVSLAGGIAACLGYQLLQPALGWELSQAPATAFLAFIIVYFSPLILDVIKSRIEGYKK
jgi:hypothetical protein